MPEDLLPGSTCYVGGAGAQAAAGGGGGNGAQGPGTAAPPRTLSDRAPARSLHSIVNEPDDQA